MRHKLREARRSLLAADLIAYESPLYQVLSLEPTSTSEQPVARIGQTLPISAILPQMLETGGAQQQPYSASTRLYQKEELCKHRNGTPQVGNYGVIYRELVERSTSSALSTFSRLLLPRDVTTVYPLVMRLWALLDLPGEVCRVQDPDVGRKTAVGPH